MRYVLDLLPIFPIAGIITGIMYFIIYKILGKKREKISKGRMLVEYLLTGWVIMFLYVTQIMSFGNGIGSLFNLKPLHQFYIAFRYGSNNAQGVWQFLLNIIMFVPLGILVPIIFKKCRNWKKIFTISFLFTLGTELLQLISRRGSDIDDIIANTVGGLCGFAIFLIFYGIVKNKKIEIEKYMSKLIIGITLLVLITGSFIGVRLCDGSSKYGNLYYGHYVPSSVDIKIKLDDKESNRKVYKYKEQITLSELEKILVKGSGFNGEWKKEDNPNGTYYVLYGNEHQRISISDYNVWHVFYEYALDEEPEVKPKDMVERDVAIVNALDELKKYDIGNVTYSSDISKTYADDNYHFIFVQNNVEENSIISGDIEVQIGQDGRVIEIYDTRKLCVFVEETSCISQNDSINIAKDVGVGKWNDKAVVTEVEESYSFIPSTGYLVPTWKIKGYLTESTGNKLDWNPEVDAVK